MSTNPAECDRTTVYAGECRNFADTEWIRFDSGRRRSPDARDGNTWLIDVAHGSFWMSDDKVRNLVPLVPARPVSLEERGELWARIRDELRGVYPSTTDQDHRKLDLAASASADTAVEYLNDRGGLGIDTREPLERALRACDQANMRAVTESNRAEAAELARDAAVARAEQAERERDGWRAAAEHRGGLLDQPAPAVTRADVEKAMADAAPGLVPYGACVDAVWSLVSGADPAVHVVRKSDLPDLEAVAARNFDLANGQTRFRDAAAEEVDEAVDEVASDLRYVLAARRVIEAEQSVDRVAELAALIESSARKSVQSAANALAVITGEEVRVDVDGLLADVHPDEWRQMARHALEQEASSDE